MAGIGRIIARMTNKTVRSTYTTAFPKLYDYLAGLPAT